MEIIPQNPRNAHEQDPRKETIAALEQFFDTFNKISDHHGLRYAVVGGMALRAWDKEAFTLYRRDGTMRDVDILITDCGTASTDELHAYANANNALPPISLSFIEDTPPKHQLFRSIVRTEDGGIALHFRDIQTPVNPQVFASHEKTVHCNDDSTLTIRTFTPETLLHLYLTRVGFLKEKDLSKIWAFARTLSRAHCNRSEHIGQKRNRCHRDYRPFHTFARAVRYRYPIYTAAMKVALALDAKIGGRINHTTIMDLIIKHVR